MASDDPAGLDAAVEAAVATGEHYESEPETEDDEAYCICGDVWSPDHAAEMFVRAAAPHIRRAVLEEAAEIVATDPPDDHYDPNCICFMAGVDAAAKRLRDRAVEGGGG